MGMDGQRHLSAALDPRKTRRFLYKRLGGPQCRSARMRKISPMSGLDPRTVKSIASRHNGYAIPAHMEALQDI